MYSYIKGTLVKRDEEYIVIDNNGIGFLINCPFSISSSFGPVDTEVKCYVYQSVREDDISLFGFYSEQQKDMFLQLITISGIGPKVALSICSQISPDKLAMAVMTDDVKMLTAVKGLGKKGAERIILELKDKLKKNSSNVSDIASYVPMPDNINDESKNVISDAVTALEVLGYKESEAHDIVVMSYEEGISLEALIKKSLSSIGRRQ